MNPETILKREILLTFTEEDLKLCELGDEIKFNRDRIRESLYSNDANYIDELWDAIAGDYGIIDRRIDEFRESGKETGLNPRKTHPYWESTEVARPITGSNDTWIGWLYWYGGGKQSYPESLEWTESARILQVKREILEVLTFSLVAE